MNKRTWLDVANGHIQLRHQGDKILQSVRLCMQNDHGDLERGQVLLKCQIAVYCDKYFE